MAIPSFALIAWTSIAIGFAARTNHSSIYPTGRRPATFRREAARVEVRDGRDEGSSSNGQSPRRSPLKRPLRGGEDARFAGSAVMASSE